VGDQSSDSRSSRLSVEIALSKDIFALLRDSSLFAVTVLLLVFPTTFNSILTNAGFEEGSFAGLKWKRQFFDTDTVLRTANETITGLQEQNATLLKALAIEGPAAGQKQREEIARLHRESLKTSEAATKVQASVRATLASNEPLIEKARLAEADASPPQTAFCYQEDRIQSGPERYSVHCHTTPARCEAARGPNPRTRQSSCESVALSSVRWAPRHPGFMGSWYQFGDEPFPPPFPQIER